MGKMACGRSYPYRFYSKIILDVRLFTIQPRFYFSNRIDCFCILFFSFLGVAGSFVFYAPQCKDTVQTRNHGNRKGGCGVNAKVRAFIGGALGVVVIFIITFSSIGYGEETKRAYYANGKLQGEMIYKNESNESLSKEYYESGELQGETLFKNGMLEGPYKLYYRNGHVREDGSYKNGYREGPYKEYYESGQLKEAKAYVNGKPEGPSEEYYPSGQLHVERNFKNGMQEGLMKSYYESGQLQSEVSYEKGEPGEGTIKLYGLDGKLMSVRKP